MTSGGLIREKGNREKVYFLWVSRDTEVEEYVKCLGNILTKGRNSFCIYICVSFSLSLCLSLNQMEEGNLVYQENFSVAHIYSYRIYNVCI